jgi:hypothetical protein
MRHALSHPSRILAGLLFALLLTGCSTTTLITPGFSAVPASLTPGTAFTVTVVGFDGPFSVTICDRPVADLTAAGSSAATTLSGTVPLMPGRACQLVASAGSESASATVEVIELLAGRSVGIFVNTDGLDFSGVEGGFRFTAYLTDLESGDLFDLTVYDSFAAYTTDVANETAPELMFFSFSSSRFAPAHWDVIAAHLTGTGARAVVMSYCIENDAAAIFGLSGTMRCYEGPYDEVSFDIDPWLTNGDDVPLELTMGVEWFYAATYSQVAEGNEAFCTLAAAVCGAYHADQPAALALWLPEAMVGGHNDELLLQIARSLF